MAKALAVTWNIPATTPVNLSSYVAEDVFCTATASPTGSLAGWSALVLTLRTRPGGTVLFTRACTITNSGTGVFTFAINAADSNPATGCGPGIFFFDVTRTDSGNQQTLLVGNYQFLPEACI